ncbi:hypothetical protein D3C87_1956610 [compost metagenome]
MLQNWPDGVRSVVMPSLPSTRMNSGGWMVEMMSISPDNNAELSADVSGKTCTSTRSR